MFHRTSLWRSTQDEGRGQNLRQNLGLSPRGIEDIEGHPVTAVLREIGGDRGVPVGPIALEIEDSSIREGLRHFGGAQGQALVDQAGDTPGGGHVDEDGAPILAGLGESFGRIGLALEWPGAGRARPASRGDKAVGRDPEIEGARQCRQAHDGTPTPPAWTQ